MLDNYHKSNNMKTTPPKIIYGCMRLSDELSSAHVDNIIDTAIEHNITVFDHADIYQRGQSEALFGKALQRRPHLREKIKIQTKCGIRFEDSIGPKRYDFSREWIQTSVENSLRRLNTERIDVLLLHRPDALVDVEELSETINGLITSGKIMQFGVSNMPSSHIQLLQKYVNTAVVANQVEVSLLKTDLIKEELFFNSDTACTITGTLPFCILNQIEIQAWGSMAGGMFSGGNTLTGCATTHLISTLAKKYSVTPEAIVLAWLLRHPSNIAPVIGTTHPERIRACANASHVRLSREDWYALLVSRLDGELP